MDPKLEAKIAEKRQKKEELFQNITYGSLPEEARRIIFEAAFEAGHSAGENEVEYFYNDYNYLFYRNI